MSNADRLIVAPYHSDRTGKTCHVLRLEHRPDAIIVDPVEMEAELYRSILDVDAVFVGVAITNPDVIEAHAMRTLAKIYRLEVLSAASSVHGIATKSVEEPRTLAGITLRAVPVPSFAPHAVMYCVRSVAFTGAIVHAGTLAPSANEFAERLLIDNLQKTLLAREEIEVIVPSIGPPTTTAAELHLSAHFREH